jgi:hypothetical protein
VTKGNLKKKKVTHKSTQTGKEEYKPKIDIADLTSDGILHSQAHLVSPLTDNVLKILVFPVKMFVWLNMDWYN